MASENFLLALSIGLTLMYSFLGVKGQAFGPSLLPNLPGITNVPVPGVNGLQLPIFTGFPSGQEPPASPPPQTLSPPPTSGPPRSPTTSSPLPQRHPPPISSPSPPRPPSVLPSPPPPSPLPPVSSPPPSSPSPPLLSPPLPSPPPPISSPPPPLFLPLPPIPGVTNVPILGDTGLQLPIPTFALAPTSPPQHPDTSPSTPTPLQPPTPIPPPPSLEILGLPTGIPNIFTSPPSFPASGPTAALPSFNIPDFAGIPNIFASPSPPSPAGATATLPSLTIPNFIGGIPNIFASPSPPPLSSRRLGPITPPQAITVNANFSVPTLDTVNIQFSPVVASAPESSSETVTKP